MILISNWKHEWQELDDVKYMNFAAHAVLPRTSADAVETAVAAKMHPYRIDEHSFFDVANELRCSLAKLIGAKPTDIALTTGAGTGAATIANLLKFNKGDEVIITAGEFPMHHATWKPFEARIGVVLKTIVPQNQFLEVQDLIDAISPKTRIISVSQVRFNDGSLLHIKKLVEVCRAQGVLVLVDVSQSCGIVPIDVNQLNADFIVGAGYKYLLGPWGTGFFWINEESFEHLDHGSYNWLSQDVEKFSELNYTEPEPIAGAGRWDAAQSSSPYNFNLSAMNASVNLVRKIGCRTILKHGQNLTNYLFDNLPGSCAPASPMDQNKRAGFGCFKTANLEQVTNLYQKLNEENVFVSLREGKIRVSPHLINTRKDIDGLLNIVNDWAIKNHV